MDLLELIVDEKKYIHSELIRPRWITDLSSTFGSAEVEKSARSLVEFFQQTNYWRAFVLQDLINFYRKKQWDVNEMLYGMNGPYLRCDGLSWHTHGVKNPPYVVSIHGKEFAVTRHFIGVCGKNVQLPNS